MSFGSVAGRFAAYPWYPAFLELGLRRRRLAAERLPEVRTQVSLRKRLIGHRDLEETAQWLPALGHFEYQQPLRRDRRPDVLVVFAVSRECRFAFVEPPIEDLLARELVPEIEDRPKPEPMIESAMVCRPRE